MDIWGFCRPCGEWFPRPMEPADAAWRCPACGREPVAIENRRETARSGAAQVKVLRTRGAGRAETQLHGHCPRCADWFALDVGQAARLACPRCGCAPQDVIDRSPPPAARLATTRSTAAPATATPIRPSPAAGSR